MQAISYPAKPSDIPTNLTGLSNAYKVKAALAVLAILLFFVLYAALVAAVGYLAYLALIYPIGKVGIYTLAIKLGAIAGSFMLVAFTLKFLFKLKSPKPPNRIEMERSKYPELWRFVVRVCEDTGAPRPKAIYVDPDVNAYVSYTNHWLSLLFPVGKELTIGLGLLDSLNLSQFKAVIAHEFGHFSQKSMKIGSYIGSANAIIHDMIFGRDKWDQLLEDWKGTDFRLSAAAWAITPIIWLIRQILHGFYLFLNVMYSSLSREMEFNADKVAVKVAGSDAIVSALWKLESGAAVWNETMLHAYNAARKDAFTQNLYRHAANKHARNESAYRDALDQLPTDGNGSRTYFKEVSETKMTMYASHPSHDQRERSAKSPYVACGEDERSPWILISNPEALQSRMTRLVYETYLDRQPDSYVSVDRFEDFIRAESEGRELAEAYSGALCERFVHVPSEKEMETSLIHQMSIEDGLHYLDDWMEELMMPVREIDAELERIEAIATGTSRERSIEVDGVSYTKKNLQFALNRLIEKKTDLETETFKSWDVAFFALYRRIANESGRGQEMERLMVQFKAFHDIHRQIVETHATFIQRVLELQGMFEIENSEISKFQRFVRESIEDLNRALEDLDSLSFVPLPNIESVDVLRGLIIKDGTFQIEPGEIFSEGRFDRVVASLERAAMHCQQLDEKHIIQFLTFRSTGHSTAA